MPFPYNRPHKAKNSTPKRKEIIDVEEYLKQFEDADGLVQCSTPEEFRKGWRAMHKGQHIQARGANIQASSVHSKERQPPPPVKFAPVSDPFPNSSTPPLKRPRRDLIPIEFSSSSSMKTGTQLRSRSDASSSSFVDIVKTRPDKQRRNYPAQISPPPRSPSASASAITPSSPDLMFVDDQSHGDDFHNDHNNDYHPPPPSPLWRRPYSMTPPTAGTISASRSTTLKRSRSPTIKLQLKFEPDVHLRGSAPPQERLRSNFKKEIITGDSATMLRVKAVPTDIIELSDEEVEKLVSTEPPAKRRKYTSSIPPQHSTFIELSSDSEPGDNFLDDDDDDDDDWNHPGLDLNDPDVWLPIPQKPNKLIMQDLDTEEGQFGAESIVSEVKTLSISNLPAYLKRERPNTSRWMTSPPPTYPGPPVYIWDKLRLAENLRFKPHPKPIAMEFPKKMVFLRPKHIDFNLHRLEVTHSFKEAPGTINVIEQKRGLTVFGSACMGGLEDVSNETLNPYNRPGSLIVRSDGKLHVLDAHSVRRRGLPERIKYYSINDVKFDPTSNAIASSGQDKRVRIWIQAEDPDTGENFWKVDIEYNYAHVPYALAFRPRSPILAVAERAVHIYNLHDEYSTGFTFGFHNLKKTQHQVGSIAWGCESTANHLFASSEPRTRAFTGAHWVFDLHTKKEAYQLDAQEAGDGMAVDLEGSTLALCTQAEPNKHILRLYDIRRREPTALASLILTPFTRGGDGGDKGFDGEMNAVTFSPEGLYVALARNDNHTHLYDRRMIRSRGHEPSEPLFDYEHTGESKAASERELYGIVNAQWIRSSLTRRTCLVTGGEDGCVRMWDPSRAVHDADNGKMVAEVNYDVSQFSVGDPFAGEQRLIVGDASGEVTIFNNIPSF